MIEDYKDLDSHKLDFHLEELLSWKKGERVFPIHLDIGPAGACVNRCVHCYLRWYGHKDRLLSREAMDNIIGDGREMNLKSIFLAGSGEPLLNPNTPDFIVKAKCSGIDVAMATNGFLLCELEAEKILPSINWIRFNALAFSREKFAELHGCDPGNRDVVFGNIRRFAELRRKAGRDVGVGIGTCVLPEAADELEDLIRFAKDAGVDYISLRPVSNNLRNEYHVDNKELYERLASRFDEWQEEYTDGKFRVLIRRNLFDDDMAMVKKYGKCFGVNFINQVDADGGIYSCGSFVGEERYLFGNLGENTYREIMESDRRRKVIEAVQGMPDAGYCDSFCRCHNINKYLWRHRNPPRDVNFI